MTERKISTDRMHGYARDICKMFLIVRFRNPDEGLPADFAAKRVSFYQALEQPRDPEEFPARL
jgi:hypothetical protein